MIDGWIESLLLLPVRRGVYALGHKQVTQHGVWLAAVLAAGPGAVLSHDDGLAAHGRRDAPEDRRIHVTTTRRGVRDQRGIKVHTARRLDPADVTVIDGVPVTALARTLYDVAGVASRADTARYLEGALSDGKVDDTELDAVVRRCHGRRGRGPARFAAARAELERLGVHLTRSVAEALVVGICDRHGLPIPRMNHRADGDEIDVAFVDQRVGIEIDSFAFHGDRQSFVADRRKIRRLQAAGWRMLSFAAVDLRDDEASFARDVAAALAQPRLVDAPTAPRSAGA